MTNESKVQHTPGPWKYDATDPDFVEVYEIGSGRKYVVASVTRQTAVAWPLPADDAQTLANARLIAAAPALLEALKWIVASAHYKDSKIPWVEVDRAKKAIALAKGAE